MIHYAVSLLTMLFVIPTMFTQAPTTSNVSRMLHDLFNEDWQWQLKEDPEAATWVGDNRYNDRLTDLSFEAIERRNAHERDMLTRLQHIDRSQLFGQDVISYDLFLRNKQIAVEGQRYPLELMPITQLGGPQLSFAQLVQVMPFLTAKDYENYLARLAAFPKYIEQVMALMKRGIETQWVLPAVPLRSVPAQIERQIVENAAASPLYKPFEQFPPAMPEAERQRLAAEGRKAITASIIPTLKTLNAFIKDTYLPVCRQEISASSLPNGAAFYAYTVRRATTTHLSPRDIHEIGRGEVARIRQEMEAVIQQVGFKGSFQDFLTFLRTDPRFYYTKSEDLVMGYWDIAKRADAELPKLFAELPRNTYGVREFPMFEAPAQTTARYYAGAADGSRAGFYMVNTYRL